MKLLAAALAVMLGSCTVVAVHGDHPRVIPVIGSALVVPPPGGAVAIDAWGFGFTESCGAVAFGAAVSHCAVVDPRGDCPVAIVKSVGPIDEDFWGRVASETRVECPSTRKEH